MIKLKTLFWVIWFGVLTNPTYAQTVSLQGKITDHSGNGILGVSVKVKNSTKGTTTDAAGMFVLERNGALVLVVSAISYKGREIEIEAGQQKIEITLEDASTGLDEVVVVGYGVQKKGDVTSAIASVKAEDFTKGTVRDVGQLVQGKVSGLRITTPSGDPNANTQINLRGLNSINGTSQPLVLIDGVPGDMNTVAPEDIESIDVLKDGSAAAIYGTRATGGVMLITTRRNTNLDARSTIEYSNYINVQTIARKPEMLTGDDYRRLIGQDIPYQDYGGNTDWLSEIMQTPISHNHNLTFFGGNSRTNFTGSINYRNWEGVLLKTGQSRFTARADLNHSMFEDKLRAHFQIINRNTTARQGGADGYAYRQALIRNPTDRIYNDEGRWQERDGYNYDNPLSRIYEAVNDNIYREMRMNGSLEYRPTHDFNIKLMVSNVQDNNLNGYSTSFNHVSTVKGGLNGTAGRSTNANNENLLELTANYMKNINKHHFTVLGGYSWQDAVYEDFNVYNFDFPSDAYSYNKLEAGSALQRGLATMASLKNKWQLVGFFGRLTYNWDERYLLMASIRREGSSRFGENNKWGTFPAVSIGWRMGNEAFMKGIKAIDDIKLRAGFGVTGTIANAPYQSQTSYNFTYQQGAYIGGKWVQGFIPARNFNPNLRWEKKEEYNAGVDFSLYKGRVSGSLDYYSRTVKDLLYNFNVPVPPYQYGSIMTNAGSMKNSGFEALVNIKVIDKEKFRWNTNFTFSFNKNKLLNLSNDQFEATSPYFDAGYTGEPIQVSTHRVEIGQPIGRFFVLKSVGVDDNGKWLVEKPDGSVVSIDEATPDDRQYYGNGIPKYLASWNNSVAFKNLDLAVNIRGAFGHDILNMQRMYYENPVNKAYNSLSNSYDLVYGKTLNNDLVYVSHYIEKGNYIKIDNVTLGYTLPKDLIKGIKNLRFYVSGLNLITITGYKGIDPEGVSYDGDFTFAPGIDDRDKYPNTRTFTAGLSVTF